MRSDWVPRNVFRNFSKSTVNIFNSSNFFQKSRWLLIVKNFKIFIKFQKNILIFSKCLRDLAVTGALSWVFVRYISIIDFFNIGTAEVSLPPCVLVHTHFWFLLLFYVNDYFILYGSCKFYFLFFLQVCSFFQIIRG